MLSEGVMPPTPQRSSTSPIMCRGMLTDFRKENQYAAVMTRRRRRRNEAELHITGTRKYNSIDDKEDDEEIAKQLAKAIKVCLSEVPNKQRAATY
ncbi:hypothetical protein SUGI_0626440 [Cryptomeria japonica]|nr:hypothetical protein SUGI_0626440 [Cryptomeria japonica]